jgi:hypothetical protein
LSCVSSSTTTTLFGHITTSQSQQLSQNYFKPLRPSNHSTHTNKNESSCRRQLQQSQQPAAAVRADVSAPKKPHALAASRQRCTATASRLRRRT